MKISDEILQWCDICCDDYIDKDCCDELRELANRIDAETVDLPKDADGVPIHIGDTVYKEDGNTANVFEIYIMQSKKNVMCTLSDGRRRVYDPHKLSHERPDSLEHIADELEAAYVKGTSGVGELTLHSWADRIRKLAKEDK